METRNLIRNFVLTLVLSSIIFSCGSNDIPSAKDISTGSKIVAEAVEKKAETITTEKETPTESIGIGPVQEITLQMLDNNLALTGQTVFEAKCTACHKIEERHIGPSLKGVTTRRRPEWIMNMILNPEGMVKEDETAKALLGEYIAPMANQNLTKEEARAILEYFRQNDLHE